MIFPVASYPTHKMLKRLLCSFALLFVANASISFAQQPPQPPTDQTELPELIRRAAIKVKEYETGFKDLTTEEEQTIEEFDAKGKTEKQRRISSDLFIYQSQLNRAIMVEYRDVKSVDGKPVKKREARLVNLLTKSAKADSVKKELDRIQRESQRYDLGNSFYGMTLNQGLPIGDKLREAFQFKLAGREQVNGHGAIVVDYHQVAAMPSFKSDLSGFPAPLRNGEVVFRGRLWLDAETAQIRREVRDMTLRLPSLTNLLVLYSFDLSYADSRFGFLTPKRIAITLNTRGRFVGPDKKPETMLGGKISFDYGAFIRFAVDSPDATIEPPTKP